MKKLLIVTDHKFYEYNDEIYDNYVFDYDFFKNYLDVFSEITVLARFSQISELPVNYKKTSGDKLEFIKIDDISGTMFFLKKRYLLKKINLNINEFDAICFRIPSLLSFEVWRENMKLSKLPYMFELIGDPKNSLINENDNYFRKLLFFGIGKLMMHRTKLITKSATCGSYVSFNHLQRQYPVDEGIITESISSIRLYKDNILDKLPPLSIKELNIIHVGSFVHIKNHNFLIELIKLLVDKKVKARLTLIGDGKLKNIIKKKVNKYGLQQSVHFEGHVTGTQNVINCLDHNNIFILPSYSEGMPRALIEAMSRGLVCFGADRGGIRELLDKEFLFNPTKPDDFLNTFFSIISNIELLEKSRIINLTTASRFEHKLLSQKREKILKILKSNLR